ncbi:hypothetical protein OUZ56_012411 [Daphnia magna]|uniref:Uncharacterized protein n=1 Tax=Daphnia magna TaxID=35525 RepID=A0ABQ9Z362_9CRUS|nr:hypothetical protein OUZ56_012411 [Daphnia magna]
MFEVHLFDHQNSSELQDTCKSNDFDLVNLLHCARLPLLCVELRGNGTEGIWVVNLVTQEDWRELLEGQKAEWAHVFENLERKRETVNFTVHYGLLYRMRSSSVQLQSGNNREGALLFDAWTTTDPVGRCDLRAEPNSMELVSVEAGGPKTMRNGCWETYNELYR